MSLKPEETSAPVGPHDDTKTHFADYASQSSSTLLPMLIVGLVLIVIGMIVAMILS